MAVDIPPAVIEAIEKGNQTNKEDTGSEDTVSSFLDASIEEEKRNQTAYCLADEKENIKKQMLLSAANSANEVCRNIIEEEKRKTKWRRYFIIFLSILLVISTGFIGLVVISTKIVASDELIIALLVYIVANIFSLLYFMVKYITDNKYIEMYKTTYHKILDFLTQDKINGNTK